MSPLSPFHLPVIPLSSFQAPEALGFRQALSNGGRTGHAGDELMGTDFGPHESGS